MRSKIHRVVLSLVACALLGPSALAGGKTRTVTFSQDVQLGGTTVRKGTYKVSFDESTKELSIISGKEVVARSTAQLEERKSSSSNGALVYTTIKDEDGTRLLMLVNMGGKYAVVSDRYTAQVNRTSTAN